MTTLFISHAQNDAGYAEKLRQLLEARSYRCWRAPAYPTQVDYSYPHMLESAILGSAAVILLWSAHAVQDEQVKRHIQIAHLLHKQLLALLLDPTELPSTLSVPLALSGSTSPTDGVAQLLPHLPEPASQELLFVLAEKAAHAYISKRYAAIEMAADMLIHRQHRSEVLAILSYLAQSDLMTGIRQKAQEVLDREKK